MKTYEFRATIHKVPDLDGAYVVAPFDLPRTFGAGRIKVHARFDGEPYDGSIVATHLDDAQNKSYILGIRKDIRARIGKQPGDVVDVTFTCAQIDEPASVYYEALLAKALRKGRTTEEFTHVIEWLLGYTADQLTPATLEKPYFKWLEDAPKFNTAALGVKGKVCGIAVAEVEDPTMRRMRILDKLVDDLARGKPLEKILIA